MDLNLAQLPMLFLAVLGAGLLIAGVAMVYKPAGVIVAGVILLAAGLTVDTDKASE